MNQYRILVVEDDEDFRATLKKALEREDYLVHTAENGKEALRLWHENIYDLVLADLQMPVMGGGELIGRLREQQELVPVIILSGEGGMEDAIEAVNQHVFSYLKKPYETALLLEKIYQALKNRDPVLLALEKLAENQQEEPILLIGKDSMSAIQLYNEVRKGTRFGKEYAREYRKNLTNVSSTPKSIDDLLDIQEVI